jgi:deferrochelatase/peroxidase EfeB
MRAQRDVAIQLTADTELALARAIVEIDQAIRVHRLPILFHEVYGGFHRDDRRSWIGFHDGINNMPSDQRLQAMHVLRDLDTPWIEGGTYMAFLRVDVDLDTWRAFDRTTQEALVGRDKLSGAPLVRIESLADGTLAVEADGRCPFRPLGPEPGTDLQPCIDPSTAGTRPDCHPTNPPPCGFSGRAMSSSSFMLVPGRGSA